MVKKKAFLLLTAVAALCLFANICHAHKLTVYAWVEEDAINGQAAYSDGSYARSCRVEIVDANGKTVWQTKTDRKGKFSCQLASMPLFPIKVVINDGMGHRDQYIIDGMP